MSTLHPPWAFVWRPQSELTERYHHAMDRVSVLTRLSRALVLSASISHRRGRLNNRPIINSRSFWSCGLLKIQNFSWLWIPGGPERRGKELTRRAPRGVSHSHERWSQLHVWSASPTRFEVVGIVNRSAVHIPFHLSNEWILWHALLHYVDGQLQWAETKEESHLKPCVPVCFFLC